MVLVNAISTLMDIVKMVIHVPFNVMDLVLVHPQQHFIVAMQLPVPLNAWDSALVLARHYIVDHQYVLQIVQAICSICLVSI